MLCAPPGTGKTTLVPLALAGLLHAGGPVRRVVVAEPRRIVARAAARGMAWLLGEEVGERVGFTVRGERRVGRRTVVEVVTTGVLLQRLQRDQELAGVAVVMLDECHERHLDADTAAAFLLDVRATPRPELWLVAASATTDAEGWSAPCSAGPVPARPRRRATRRPVAFRGRPMTDSPSRLPQGEAPGRAGARRAARRVRRRARSTGFAAWGAPARPSSPRTARPIPWTWYGRRRSGPCGRRTACGSIRCSRSTSRPWCGAPCGSGTVTCSASCRESGRSAGWPGGSGTRSGWAPRSCRCTGGRRRRCRTRCWRAAPAGAGWSWPSRSPSRG